MNVISPLINIQPAADAGPRSSATDHADTRDTSSGFADTLSKTHDRPPVRRTSVKKHASEGGGSLPSSGNMPPAAAPALPAKAPETPKGPDRTGTQSVTSSSKPATQASAPAGKADAADAAPAAPAATPAADAAAAKAAQAAATAAAEAALAAADVAAPAALPSAEVPDPGATPTAAVPADLAAAKAAVAHAEGSPDPTATAAAAASAKAAAALAAANATAGTDAAGGAVATTADARTAGTTVPAAAAPATQAAPAQPTVDPAIAALLARSAGNAGTPDATAKPSDSRVVDATLQSPDSQNPIVGDVTSLNGTSAGTPALAASLAGAAQVAGAVSGPAGVTDKNDKGSLDAIAASNQAASVAPQAPAVSAADQTVPTLKVQAPVDSSGFAQDVAGQVSVMVDNKLGSAKLQINPPSLGPIEVRIAIQNDHAQVSFTSHSATTRDALESSSPHLREMLGSQGFAQVSVDISHRSFQDRTPTPHSYDWSFGNESKPGSVSSDLGVGAGLARSSNGTLDAYA